jgi:hypothetical protein
LYPGHVVQRQFLSEAVRLAAFVSIESFALDAHVRRRTGCPTRTFITEDQRSTDRRSPSDRIISRPRVGLAAVHDASPSGGCDMACPKVAAHGVSDVAPLGNHPGQYAEGVMGSRLRLGSNLIISNSEEPREVEHKGQVHLPGVSDDHCADRGCRQQPGQVCCVMKRGNKSPQTV